jgi:hypothetical protein
MKGVEGDENRLAARKLKDSDAEKDSDTADSDSDKSNKEPKEKEVISNIASLLMSLSSNNIVETNRDGKQCGSKSIRGDVLGEELGEELLGEELSIAEEANEDPSQQEGVGVLETIWTPEVAVAFPGKQLLLGPDSARSGDD